MITRTPIPGTCNAIAVVVIGSMSAHAATAQAVHQTELHEVRVEVVAGNLEHPWGIALLPDGRFLVTERNPGNLRLGSVGGELSDPLDGVPDIFRYEGETGRSQAGLFDVKLHPDFETNGLVYLSLSKPTERGAALAIVRARLVDEMGAPHLTEVEEIFEMNEDDQYSGGLHFGGRMAFDINNRALFLSIGDRRDLSRAQDVEDQAGSILRMSWDGDPMGASTGDLQGNPLAEGDLDEFIWSWGHRNPQALTVHPEHGSVWIVDHGPEGGDEVNRIEEGRNYGWPFFTGGVDYSGAPLGYDAPPDGVVAPLHVFEETIAPSGLAFPHAGAFPEWEGDMLIGGLAAEGIVRVRFDPGGEVVSEEVMLHELERRIRDVQVAPDGSVWVITEHSDGEVLRLTAPTG